MPTARQEPEMPALQTYSVTLAVNEPHIAATVRFDHIRAESEAEAVDVARIGARNHFGADHPWQVERVEVA